MSLLVPVPVAKVPRTPQVDRAIELYQDFHWYEPDRFFKLCMEWPDRQGECARALVTSYRSDKFDGIMRDYKHRHKPPYPAIIREKQPGDLPWKRHFLPRGPNYALAFLGDLLDIQIDFPGCRKPTYLDFKSRASSHMPILAADPDRNLLVVVSRNSGEAFLLWSPIMRVTERGIID